MKTISICIPTHEMGGLGHTFLRKSFEKLKTQTFKEFDIVVSDHSKNDDIKKLCEEYADKFDVHYFRNTEGVGSSSININNAIKHASGKLIKILFMDDFLFSDTALQEIVDNFDMEKDHWMITACEHSNDGVTYYRPFYPKYNNKIFLGRNTISSPSVITIKNDNPLFFDEKLVWLMDVEYYKRCYDTFGKPKILDIITVVNGTGDHQGIGGYKSRNKKSTNKLKWSEYLYVLGKYEKGFNYYYYKFTGFIKALIKN